MPDFSGRLHASGPVAILVSRYNELITRRLLDGALACCHEAGLPSEQIDVVWVPGAFELPAAAAAAAQSHRYSCLVALGAVFRGDTPHFEYVAGEAARGLNLVAVHHTLPVGFGVLTVDTMQQALDRAGGNAGNKGQEAAAAAIQTADVLARLRAYHAEARD
ncbi:MAG TPA: 6,7-dimethyl-8-ribityllumazine synthase [Gemmatimonadales bacterium]|nr:6,7-dimethyl-8-ribityllumazine synthase [Gemmatimonadales bacterium]